MVDLRVTSELVAIGQVVGTHNIFGETRVYPLTDFPERFLETETVLVGEAHVTMHIESARRQKNMLLIKFAEIKDLDMAMKLKGSYLYVDESEVVALPENSFYTWKLTGLRVLTEEGVVVGTVKDVQTGAGNDLLVVDVASKTPVYVPFVKQFVCSIDLDAREIRIRPIPGLIE